MQLVSGKKNTWITGKTGKVTGKNSFEGKLLKTKQQENKTAVILKHVVLVQVVGH